MTPAALASMPEAVDRLLSLAGEGEARRILEALGGRAALAELERQAARRLAVHLLQQRAPRWQIRDRLVSRGINWRTAYRVIDAALSTGPRGSVIAGPGMASGPETLLPSQEAEKDMALSVKDLQAKLKELRAQLSKLDVIGTRELADKAQETHQRLLDEGRRGMIVGTRNEDQVNQAAITMRTRRNEAENVQRQAAALQKEIDHLARMLNGEQRVAQAQEALAKVKELVRSAADQVQAAESTVSMLDSLIQEEERAFEAAKAGAAAQLLAAVKARGDVSQVQAASRDRVATLELAKTEAMGELEAARAALKAVQEREAKALRDVHTAQADVTELAFRIAQDAYTEALAAQMAAYWRAHRTSFGTEDVRGKAGDLSMKLLEAPAA